MIDSLNGFADLHFLRSLQLQEHSHGQLTEQDPTALGAANAERAEGSPTGERETNLGVAEGDNKKQEQPEGLENSGPKTEGELTDEEKAEIRELKAIDRKVRQHEQAHLAAASGIALSGPNYSYKRGPDGVNYAVGGDVQIDASKESDPDATIAKAQKISAAALAPGDPSPQDRSVAASARAMEAEARVELARERQEEAQESQQASSVEPTAGAAQNDDREQNNIVDINEGAELEGEQEHPGIGTYQTNQNFAPSSPLAPEFESLQSGSNASHLVRQTNVLKPGSHLDLVA
ncbi:MAG: hypothetical protein GY940_23275 [bacterium]|nr:hypothetical protein [bacterium]